jgi:hypothetical protein
VRRSTPRARGPGSAPRPQPHSGAPNEVLSSSRRRSPAALPHVRPGPLGGSATGPLGGPHPRHAPAPAPATAHRRARVRSPAGPARDRSAPAGGRPPDAYAGRRAPRHPHPPVRDPRRQAPALRQPRGAPAQHLARADVPAARRRTAPPAPLRRARQRCGVQGLEPEPLPRYRGNDARLRDRLRLAVRGLDAGATRGHLHGDRRARPDARAQELRRHRALRLVGPLPSQLEPGLQRRDDRGRPGRRRRGAPARPHDPGRRRGVAPAGAARLRTRRRLARGSRLLDLCQQLHGAGAGDARLGARLRPRPLRRPRIRPDRSLRHPRHRADRPHVQLLGRRRLDEQRLVHALARSPLRAARVRRLRGRPPAVRAAGLHLAAGPRPVPRRGEPAARRPLPRGRGGLLPLAVGGPRGHVPGHPGRLEHRQPQSPGPGLVRARRPVTSVRSATCTTATAPSRTTRW